MKRLYKRIEVASSEILLTLALFSDVGGAESVDAADLDRLEAQLSRPNYTGAEQLPVANVQRSHLEITNEGEVLAVLHRLKRGENIFVCKARYGTNISVQLTIDFVVTDPNETTPVEISEDVVLVESIGDGGGGGEFPTDYAKQGDNPTATLTDTQAYAQAAAEAAQSLTSLDSDINAGKQAIAAAITSKGVSGITPQDTLVEMANGVMQIAQQPIEIDGGDMYAAQLTGDSTLWDLYQVLAQMKNRFINASYEHGGQTYNFEALIVCEYYKGYDSLQLQGADAYYTCDGDFYDYASPNHVWHDSDNSKVNRWVCFLYTTSGSRLDITNTAISPRSMYIGGHIGTIEYFVNGRLTELVCGVEETDVLDNFNQKGFTQPFSSKNSFINIKNATGFRVPNSVFTYLHINNETELQVSSPLISTQSQYVVIDIDGGANVSSQTSLLYVSDVPANVVGIEIRGDVRLTNSYATVVGGSDVGTSNADNLIFLYVNGNIRMSGIGTRLFAIGRHAYNLIDVKVGALVTSMSAVSWNPTNVLADADKKAQLIENIKNHILARVSDATGGTQLVFTVSTNMYNAIASETITWQDQTMTLADAFLTKNWLLAGA